MEMQSIVEQMIEVNARLDNAIKVLFKYAKTKAESERIYRMELAKEIMRLRSEGTQATVISDLSRGKVAELRFTRDFNDTHYRATIESIDVLKTQMSALQSILKYQTET